MVTAYVAELERLVSLSRLDRYRPANRDDLDTVVAYLYNVALSESLLQGIAAVEIALRNSIHNVFTAHFGTEQWFWAALRRDDLKIVNEKWLRLADRLKQPPSAGKIIAELTLGFWPFLFDSRYKDLWWDNGEVLLKSVFPFLPINVPPHLKIGRVTVFERLSLFAELRNRAMHHEPILYGLSRPNLGSPPPVVHVDAIHAQIIETLGWISPQLVLTLGFVDRFPDVYSNERERIEAKLKAHFGIP